MPANRKPASLCGTQRLEHRLPRNTAMNLHEVHAERGQRIDATPCLLRRTNTDVRDRLIVEVEVRTGGDDPRTRQRPTGDVAPIRLDRVPRSAHVANSGHAIRYIQR